MNRLLSSLIACPLLSLTTGAQASSSAAGDTREVTIPSKTYPAGRHAWVYTPPGYPAACAGACTFMLMFDGAGYLGAIPLPEILDSLIARKLAPPTVAVLFDNGGRPGRIEDLANSRKFAAFVSVRRRTSARWAGRRHRSSARIGTSARC